MRCGIKQGWQPSQKSLKNHQKMIQKSTKNHQKSTKNLLKSALGPQDAPRPPQDLSKPENREEWTPPPATLFGGFSGHVGLQEPLKGHSKSIQNFDRLRYPFSIDFGGVLGGFWEPCWLPRCTINWAPILNDFWIDFLSIFTRNWPPQNLNFNVFA